METKRDQHALKIHFFILAILFSVGTIGHILEASFQTMIALTPGFLLLVSFFTIGLSMKEFTSAKQTKKILIFSAFMGFWYLTTLALEISGANWGWFFGDYDYGSILGLQLFNTPLVIGLNWVCVSLGGFYLAEKIVNRIETEIYKRKGDNEKWNLSQLAKTLLLGLLTAAIITLFDVLLEPVAISLGYWNWAGGEIPLSNYLTWFGLGFAIGASANILRKYLPKNIAWFGNLLILETVFFAILFVAVV